jgi:hypothetical protein
VDGLEELPSAITIAIAIIAYIEVRVTQRVTNALSELEHQRVERRHDPTEQEGPR